jgi:hypothetical protein
LIFHWQYRMLSSIYRSKLVLSYLASCSTATILILRRTNRAGLYWCLWKGLMPPPPLLLQPKKYYNSRGANYKKFFHFRLFCVPPWLKSEYFRVTNKNRCSRPLGRSWFEILTYFHRKQSSRFVAWWHKKLIPNWYTRPWKVYC